MSTNLLSSDDLHSNLTLQQVLCAAPRLLQLIPAASLAALVATSRGPQRCSHAYVTSTSGVPNEHIQLLADGEWPLLQKLDFSNTALDSEGLHILVQRNWSMLKSLSLRATTIKDLHALAGAQWPALACLDVSSCRGLDPHVI